MPHRGSLTGNGENAESGGGADSLSHAGNEILDAGDLDDQAMWKAIPCVIPVKTCREIRGNVSDEGA